MVNKIKILKIWITWACSKSKNISNTAFRFRPALRCDLVFNLHSCQYCSLAEKSQKLVLNDAVRFVCKSSGKSMKLSNAHT